MKKLLPLLLYGLLIATSATAQVGADSTSRKDTIPVKKDSSAIIKKDSTVRRDTTARRVSGDTSRRRDSNQVRPPASRDSNVIRATIPQMADSPVVSNPPVQTGESTIEPAITEDTLAQTIPDTYSYTISSFVQVLKNHPYFNFFGKPLALTAHIKKSDNKDGLFYFMTGLLIYFGLIRLLSGRYVENLMALFFRATMRQQQIRDQLLQSPLPSLFLNLLFFVNGGVLLSFIADFYDFSPVENRWLLQLYGAALLLCIYLGKFILLKLTGWVFNVSAATDTYIFIVFLVNKIIGIFLLPVLILMSFAGPLMFAIMLTLTYTMLVFFMAYRFIISYKPIRNEIRVNRFHFFLYLCAFEIAPLLLIYKVLLIFVERSH